MATRRSPLMDEIYDQFLVCKICFELYKRPKTLQCLHTFCMECLEQHKDAELDRSYRYLLYSRAISCPICRKKTELPSGGVRRLPDNFLVANLGAVVSRRLSDTKVALCEICKPEIPPHKKQATCRCLDCSKLLCKKCVDLHRNTKVTQNHSIFDIEVEKDIECKVHKGETVRFYCEPCEMCICVVCTFVEHKGHEVSSFAEGMQKHSRSLDNLVEVCKDRIDLVKDQLDLIYKCETQIKDAEESIRDMAIETISDIRLQEKDTVKKMYDAYGDDTLDFIKEKEVLQDSLDNLQSTCNLTDIITKDRSLELLLLKKEIQEKLQNLLQRQVAQPPDNAMKEVKFIPGNVVFGYLSVKGGNGEKNDIVDESGDDFCKPSTSCNDISHLSPVINNKCNDPILKDMMCQTESIETSMQYTTVGNLLKQICDQLTQTDMASSSDRSCSPIQSLQNSPLASPKLPSPSSTKTMHTNTSCTPTMRRKVQTETLKTFDESTETIGTQLSSRCTNTEGVHSKENSTLTMMQESRSKSTDTKGLVLHGESGTATTEVLLASTASETDYIPKVNKCSGTLQPNLKDKMCGTMKLVQHNRETMTGFIAKMDMGISAKIQGEDKAIGTKTIVTVHSSNGDGDVRTSERSCETPWNDVCVVDKCDSGTMYEANVTDRCINTEPIALDIVTKCLNMVHKDTETKPTDLRNISVNTMSPQMKSRGLNTAPHPVAHKCIPVQQDFLPKKPRMDTQISQTELSIDGEMNKQTQDVLTLSEKDKCTPPLLYHNGTTMSSLVSTSEISTSTTSLIIPDVVDSTDVSTQANVEAITEPKLSDEPTNLISHNVDKSALKSGISQHANMKQCVEGNNSEIQSSNILVDNQNTFISGPSDLLQKSNSDSLVKSSANDAGATTYHNVLTSDMQTSTESFPDFTQDKIKDRSFQDKATHTSVSTAEVGVLKRPHSVSRGVSTKRSKLTSTATVTDEKVMTSQNLMTDISHGTKMIAFSDMCTNTTKLETVSQNVGTPQVHSSESSTSMPSIKMRDTMSSPINFSESVDRGCSPITFEITVDRASSPVKAMTEETGVDAICEMKETSTSTTIVKMVDTCSGYDRPKYSDKQNSPIRNLVSTRTKFTCTPHITRTDRAGSPIATDTSEQSTNTAIMQVTDRSASPLRSLTADQATLAIASLSTKSVGNHADFQDQGTAMKQVRFTNKCTGMPQVSFSEKASLTTRIHVMHKNVSTENIQTKDQSTGMTVNIAEPYKDLVAPKKAVTCTRGTLTQTVPMQTKETSTPIHENTDRASSPVAVQTSEKGIMANKAEMLETKESYQSVGRGKGSRTLSDSPRPSLESIREDSQESGSSSDEGSYKDALPDLPVFGSPRYGSPRSSPRLMQFKHPLEGRPQMGLGFSSIGHRDKFWRSSPTLGTSPSHSNLNLTMGAGMLYPDARPPPVPFCKPKTEAATSTKDVSKESRSTSTTDIEKQDKAVCTTPETVTMQGKMAECINKLKTVRQRLEQQPIYSTASSTRSPDKESESHTPIPSAALLSVKSKSVGSNLHDGEYSPFDSPSLRRKPVSFSSTSESPSEGSDQEQHTRGKLNKARKQRLEINQLLRSSSLPESPDPPSISDSSPGTKPKVPHLPPKGGDKRVEISKRLTKERPKSPKDRIGGIKEQASQKPRTVRERPKSARSAETKERPIRRQHSHESLRTPQPLAEVSKPKMDHKSSDGTSRSPITTLKNKKLPPLIDRKSSLIGLLSPKVQQKAKAKPTAATKFDDLHPLLPSSPRNTRRLSEGTAKLVGETARQRRERLEQQLSFEDRKALTRQYFQDTRPTSPASKPRSTRPKSAKSAATKESSILALKPPKVPNSE